MSFADVDGAGRLSRRFGRFGGIVRRWMFRCCGVLLAASVMPLLQSQLKTDAVEVCIVADDRINECSGLAVSRSVDGAFWMHNDSGDAARLFLVGSDGQTQVELKLKNEDPFDWEDMCSFRLDGSDWLLIGDIGDNAGQRGDATPECRLLLLREPDRDDLEKAAKTRSRELEARVRREIRFRYPDGPHDSESLAVDAANGEILLLTKSLPGECRLFRIPLTTGKGETKVTAEEIAAPLIPYATAMDVSMDGNRMVIISPFGGVCIVREPGESWSDAFRDHVQPLSVPMRRQGETVCFGPDAESIFVNSEFAQQPLWKLSMPTPEP